MGKKTSMSDLQNNLADIRMIINGLADSVSMQRDYIQTLQEENKSLTMLNKLLSEEVYRLRKPYKSMYMVPTEPPTTLAPRMYRVMTKPQSTRGPVDVSVAPVAKVVILYAY